MGRWCGGNQDHGWSSLAGVVQRGCLFEFLTKARREERETVSASSNTHEFQSAALQAAAGRKRWRPGVALRFAPGYHVSALQAERLGTLFIEIMWLGTVNVLGQQDHVPTAPPDGYTPGQSDVDYGGGCAGGRGASQFDGELTRRATRHLSLGHPPGTCRVDGEEFVGGGARDKFCRRHIFLKVQVNGQTKWVGSVERHRSSMESCLAKRPGICPSATPLGRCG